jgi:hypothetical protein
MALALLALGGIGFYGITKATQAPTVSNASGDPTELSLPAGATTLAEAVQAQDARENGFFPGAVNRKAMSVYSWNQNVLDPGKVSVTKFTKYKNTISADHSAFVYNNLKGVFNQDYQRPILPTPTYVQPGIAVPHPGAEIKSGQNLDGAIPILGSNPYTYQMNPTRLSTLNNNQGWNLSQTYGNKSTVNYDRFGEVRMSWAGLQNPWRLSGAQYNLYSSYLPPDKDQLTGAVPLAHPQNVYDVGNRPTQVTAPPQGRKTANVFNRSVRVGRSH